MTKIRFGAIGLLVSSAIGAGIFSLPYVAQVSGWGTLSIYLIGIGALLTFVHGAYGEALDRVPGHHRLTGLVSLYLPRRVFNIAALGILGGLILTLVVFLILATSFAQTVFPRASYVPVIILIWATGSFPLLLGLRRMVLLEFVGAVALGAIIVGILASTKDVGAVFALTPFSSGRFFFPFAPVLFSFAAWTAIGPMREYERRVGAVSFPRFSSIAWGTAIVAALYSVFVVGIFGSGATITPDTISGLANWQAWAVALLGAFGLIALWTTYIPIAAEARDSLARDFNWSLFSSTVFVVFIPLLLIALGLKSFIKAVELSGGVFLSVQYIFIALVAKYAVPPTRFRRIALNLTIVLFSIAAVYELYRFVVPS